MTTGCTPHITPPLPPTVSVCGLREEQRSTPSYSSLAVKSVAYLYIKSPQTETEDRERTCVVVAPSVTPPSPHDPPPPPSTPRSNGSGVLLMWKRGQTLDGISLCSLRRWPTFSQSGAQKWSSHTLDGLALRNTGRAASAALDVPLAASHLRGSVIFLVRLFDGLVWSVSRPVRNNCTTSRVFPSSSSAKKNIQAGF